MKYSGRIELNSHYAENIFYPLGFQADPVYLESQLPISPVIITEDYYHLVPENDDLVQGGNDLMIIIIYFGTTII